MAVNLFKLQKWLRMFFGNSVYHVCQDEGKCYSKSHVEGYYNNLTDKVLRFGRNDNEVPTTKVDSGEELYFSIAIFQYGLAAYDLYLQKNDRNMMLKFQSCANWAVENQQSNGSWITFSFENREQPYSSMAQGEGISLLVRAYLFFKHEKYKTAADKALSFMLQPKDEGGVSEIKNDGLYLFEYTYLPLVLNGWIFSAWGIFDYAKAFNAANAMKMWNLSVAAIAKSLSQYDLGYWSRYDCEKMIASPFYHDLHIAQLRVMYDLTGEFVFLLYAQKFAKYKATWFNRKRAFIIKALQKILD